MKFSLIALMTAAFLAQSGFAENLINLSGSLTDSGVAPVYGLDISQTASVVTGTGTTENLVVVGAGERDEGAIATYVAQLLIPASAKAGYANVDESSVLDYLSKLDVVAMDLYVLPPLIGIPSGLLASSLSKSQAANVSAGVIPQDAGILAGLSDLSKLVKSAGRAPYHSHIQIVWLHRNDGDYVGFQPGTPNTVWTKAEPNGFARAVLSFWFGNVDEDSNLADLKTNLVNYMKDYLKGNP